MKRTKWIAVLCALLAVMTVGTAFAKYTTTLTEKFNLSILAQKYTLTYDANGGTFADGETTKSFTQYGNDQFTVISDKPTSIYGDFFGWDNAGTTDVVESLQEGSPITVPVTGYTLRALWKAEDNLEDDRIQPVDPGENDYGVGVKGEIGKFERIFVNLGQLDPDYTYKIEFDYSVDGIYNDSDTGGYGWLVIDQTLKDKASNLSTPTYTKDNRPGINPTLNPLVDGPFTHDEPVKYDDIHREGLFVPSSGNNYLWLDVSDFADGDVMSYHYLDNLKVTRLGGVVKHNFTDNDASISNNKSDVSGNYSFTMNAKIGTHERLGIALPYDFTVGKKYKLKFTYGGPSEFIGGSENNSYSYNFTVSNDISCLNNKERMDIVDTWAGIFAKVNSKEYEYVFTATNSKMYLLLHLAELQDGASHNINLSGIKIEETTEPPTTLNITFEDEEVPPIGIDITGISENLDWWMADVDMQLPEVGKDYGLVFEAYEGYRLPEYITIIIDETLYQVYTDGLEHRPAPTDGSALPIMPAFDPATGTLTIPAGLLTEGTQVISIEAAAVPVSDGTEDSSDDEESAGGDTVSGGDAVSEDNTVSSGNAASGNNTVSSGNA